MGHLLKTFSPSPTIIVRLGIALTGGILMGLTTAPVNAWFLAWVALVPLWIPIIHPFPHPDPHPDPHPQGWVYKNEVLSALLSACARARMLRDALPHSLKRSCFGMRCLRGLDGMGSLKYSLFLGLAWGIGYHGIALFWITGIHPMTWLGVPWLASLAIALFCWIFITLWGASLVAVWSAGLSLAMGASQCIEKPGFSKKPGFWTTGESPRPQSSEKFPIALLRVLMGVAFWCVLEGLWSTGSLWWTSLSFTQSPDNLAILQLGKISGPNTITAAIVAVNGLIAETWINSKVGRFQTDSLNQAFPDGSREGEGVHLSTGRAKHSGSNSFAFVHDLLAPQLRPYSWKYLNLAVGLLLTLHLVGFFLYSRPLHDLPAAALKVGIIQGNIPNEIKLYTAGGRRALSGYTRGYKALAAQGVDAVLIPETALPFVWTAQNNSSFERAIRETGAIAWVGAFGQEGNSLTNSLFTVTGTGDIFSRYDKIKLVPLGEFIPFEQFLGKLIDRLSPLDAHLVAGKAEQLFDTPFGPAIAAICYDSAFAEVFRLQAADGGQFILTAANNAHYSPTMPAQHHAQDVMRAIETDRWAVRATNTGYSAIVDPQGRTVWISGINTYEIHAATIYPRQTQTLYVHWGDWLTPVLVGLAALGCMAFWQKSK